MTFDLGEADHLPLMHGGNLAAARARFPRAPEPFIDLSTGINPHCYPFSLPPDLLARLPEPAALEALSLIAADAYGAGSPAHIVPAPGTHILVSLIASLMAPGRAVILGPTYAEHARVARLAGHAVSEASGIEALKGADLAVVVNPNNPDGKLISRDAMLALLQSIRANNGVLVVDEAFMDAMPEQASLAREAGAGNLVVLRSFGKFFGLAGLRLSFACTEPKLAARLAAMLGPWPVGAAAIAAGTAALADRSWITATRARLIAEAARLDQLLMNAGLEIVGGTPLFRLAQISDAIALFERLGRHGIITRHFPDKPTWLRFGLPGDDEQWERLRSALADVS